VRQEIERGSGAKRGCELAARLQQLSATRLEAPVHLIQEGERRGAQDLLAAASVDVVEGELVDLHNSEQEISRLPRDRL
jgi:hypothetical protein